MQIQPCLLCDAAPMVLQLEGQRRIRQQVLARCAGALGLAAQARHALQPMLACASITEPYISRSGAH